MHFCWVHCPNLESIAGVKAWTPQSVPMDVNPIRPQPRFRMESELMPKVVHCLQHFAQACSARVSSPHLHPVKDFIWGRKNRNPRRRCYHVLVISQVLHDRWQVSIFPCAKWKVVEHFLRGPCFCCHIRSAPSTTSQARKEKLDPVGKGFRIAPGQRSWVEETPEGGFLLGTIVGLMICNTCSVSRT